MFSCKDPNLLTVGGFCLFYRCFLFAFGLSSILFSFPSVLILQFSFLLFTHLDSNNFSFLFFLHWYLIRAFVSMLKHIEPQYHISFTGLPPRPFSSIFTWVTLMVFCQLSTGTSFQLNKSNRKTEYRDSFDNSSGV